MRRRAYIEDEEASVEFESLVESQRNRDHVADVESLEALLKGATTMSLEEAESLLRVVNRARLTLAARAGVFESGEGWETRISEDPSLAAVAWLGYLQSDLLSALMGSEGTDW
jgi:hypothetical protein